MQCQDFVGDAAAGRPRPRPQSCSRRFACAPMAAFFPRGNHLRSRRLFSRNWENNHGTEVFEEGIRQSRARNEKAQGRHFEERPFRPEGQEPQASNRDRSFGSESRRKESPEEGYEEKEDRQKAQIKKITEFLIYFAPSLPDAPIGA